MVKKATFFFLIKGGLIKIPFGPQMTMGNFSPCGKYPLCRGAPQWSSHVKDLSDGLCFFGSAIQFSSVQIGTFFSMSGGSLVAEVDLSLSRINRSWLQAHILKMGISKPKRLTTPLFEDGSR